MCDYDAEAADILFRNELLEPGSNSADVGQVRETVLGAAWGLPVAHKNKAQLEKHPSNLLLPPPDPHSLLLNL